MVDNTLTLQDDQLTRLRLMIAAYPERIGHYVIEQQLGEGGFGVVYRARQEQPVQRTVALKLLKRGMDSAAILRRFELERQSLASMNHPGVAAVFDAGVSDEGQHYFVMEYVDGLPITTWANDQNLGIKARLKLMYQVCDAITHAHQKGIIHRDIKPSNVLVTGSEGSAQVKVIDFGIAKALESGPMAMSQITEQAMLIGTPEYMSPEQASGGQQPIDTRTDVYALGVLLYELLTGQLPFASSDLRNSPIDEVFRVIREQEPPRPSTRLSRIDSTTVASVAAHRSTLPDVLIRELRRELEWIPLKALRKLPDERYQSPAQMRDDISRYLTNEPLLAGPEAASYRVRKFLFKHRWPVAAACAIAISLVAGAIGTTVMAFRASAARDDAIEQTQLAESAETTTTAMNDFLVGLLHQATPRVSRGKEIPVSQVVELALANLDEEFPSQPRVRLGLRAVLSGVLSDLGRTPEAGDALRKAVVEAESILGPDDEITLSLLNELASFEAETGDFAAAVAVYRDLLTRCERVFGKSEGRTLVVVNDLATSLRDQGKVDDAEVLYRRALAERRRVLGEGNNETLQTMIALSGVLEAKGEMDKALEMVVEARELCIKHLGANHPDTIHATESYAGMMWSLERFDEAELLFKQVIALDTQMYGETHPQTLNAKTNLGLVYDGQGRSEEAEPLLRAAYAGFKELYGPANMSTIIVANNLATILESLNQPEEAAEIYQELITACREKMGEGHYVGIMIADNLGTLRQSQGRLEEAEQILAEALALAEEHLGKDDPTTKTVAAHLEAVREQTQ